MAKRTTTTTRTHSSVSGKHYVVRTREGTLKPLQTYKTSKSGKIIERTAKRFSGAMKTLAKS